MTAKVVIQNDISMFKVISFWFVIENCTFSQIKNTARNQFHFEKGYISFIWTILRPNAYGEDHFHHWKENFLN